MYCIWKSNLILLTFLFMKLCVVIFVFSFSYCVLVYLGFDCSIYNFQMCNLILLAFVGIRNQAFCLSDHFSTPTWPHHYHHHHHHHHRCIIILIIIIIIIVIDASPSSSPPLLLALTFSQSKWIKHQLLLAVQDSAISDLVTDSLS